MLFHGWRHRRDYEAERKFLAPGTRPCLIRHLGSGIGNHELKCIDVLVPLQRCLPY